MFKRFEEIEAWQLARELTKAVYALVKGSSFSHDFGLSDQIRRASVSVMANIAEGHERDGTKEFIQFLSCAKGSVGEVRSHLYVALDATYIDQQPFDALSTLTFRIAAALSALIKALRSSDISGQKFRIPSTLNPCPPAPLNPCPPAPLNPVPLKP